MSWISVILVGFVAGLIARLFARDRTSPRGCLATTALGVVGAAVFTWIGQQLGLYAAGEWAGLLGSVVGALLVLAVWQAVMERRR
ncbi:MAG: GlsB/YeaQ/YmgE family stress response membrane protein [Sphingomonadaceae bacterium]|uniref:GlsB/YeaQ/YmgE family stress response membrane protein n=1 Tax=Thermaurantiacus sp. TaxID=2820283 RepID=UPI00298F3DD8|nr:GlsB/YeaQ/YmgE family stress response membrane protein [Thermaurantiacus sp.]MCS6987321.1 GlsB/YeaQ/YmgE family stress response membrane protein [Sphingomonadaceae bacterium]MDW8414542.1 GlsB/YeaQ/YmgE family stress response membrane protein [Thermaurantiacus sp.]